MSESCATCGKAAKVDAQFTLEGVTFTDAYCGACGVNWGVRSDALRDHLGLTMRKHKRAGKSWSRLDPSIVARVGR